MCSFGSLDGLERLNSLAASAATLCQLQQQGMMSNHLTVNPEVTFWRSSIQRCTEFAFESFLQPFRETARWGEELVAPLLPTAHLLHWLYVVLDVPGIKAIKSSHRREVRDLLPKQNFPSVKMCKCSHGNSSSSSSSSDFSNSSSSSSFDDSSSQFSSPSSSSSSFSSSSSSFSDSSSSSNSSCSCSHGEDPSCDDSGLKKPYAFWVDSLGFAAIQRCALTLQNSVIGCVDANFLNCWEELSGEPGKRLEEMVGHCAYPNIAELVAASKRSRRLYVPIPFECTRHSGSAFPMVAVGDQPLMLHVKLAPLHKLIRVSSDDKDILVVKCADDRPLESHDVRACIDTTYVYLSADERDRFATSPYQQLITQTQHQKFESFGKQNVKTSLNAQMSAIEMIWFVQQKCFQAANKTFDYSGCHGLDPILRARFDVNGQPRFDREGPYFRLCQPWQHHKNIPRSFVYCHSFSADPEDCRPNATFPFLKDSTYEFGVTLQHELINVHVEINLYIRSFNIIEFSCQRGYLLYC